MFKSINNNLKREESHKGIAMCSYIVYTDSDSDITLFIINETFSFKVCFLEQSRWLADED